MNKKVIIAALFLCISSVFMQSHAGPERATSLSPGLLKEASIKPPSAVPPSTKDRMRETLEETPGRLRGAASRAVRGNNPEHHNARDTTSKEDQIKLPTERTQTQQVGRDFNAKRDVETLVQTTRTDKSRPRITDDAFVAPSQEKKTSTRDKTDKEAESSIKSTQSASTQDDTPKQRSSKKDSEIKEVVKDSPKENVKKKGMSKTKKAVIVGSIAAAGGAAALGGLIAVEHLNRPTGIQDEKDSSVKTESDNSKETTELDSFIATPME